MGYESKLDVFEDFQSAENVDVLWMKFKNVLSHFGISSAIYGVSHSALATKEDGLEGSSWYRCDHPKEYRSYFDEHFHIGDDASALHCLEYTSPYLWHDPLLVENQTESQKQFLSDSYEFGMGVGVSLPIRFNQFGVGGVGLSTDRMSEKKFEKIWKSSKDEIIVISRWFDEFARSEKTEGVYTLAKRESEVLTWLAIGRNTEQIAEQIGTASSTVEKQIRSARKKLNARNNSQAIAKALTFKLIRP